MPLTSLFVIHELSLPNSKRICDNTGSIPTSSNGSLLWDPSQNYPTLRHNFTQLQLNQLKSYQLPPLLYYNCSFFFYFFKILCVISLHRGVWSWFCCKKNSKCCCCSALLLTQLQPKHQDKNQNVVCLFGLLSNVLHNNLHLNLRKPYLSIKWVVW